MKKSSPFVAGKNRLTTCSGLFRTLGFLALSACASQVAQAQSVWNGTGTAWNDPANWTPNTLPSATIPAEFNSPFTNQPTLPSSQSVQGIWVTGSGTTGDSTGLTTIGGTGTLTIGNAAVFGSTTASVLLDGAGNNSLTINQAITATGGIFIVNNNGTLTMSNTVTGAETLTNNGTGAITVGTLVGQNQIFNDNGGGTITVGAITNSSGSGNAINSTNTASIVNIGGMTGATTTGTLTITSVGTVNLTGTIANLTTAGVVINGGSTGIVNVTGSGSVTSSKGVTLNSGTLNLASAHAVTGTVVVDSGGGTGSVILGSSTAVGGVINFGPTGSTPTNNNVTATVSASTNLTGANSVGASININSQGNSTITIGGSNAVSGANDLTFNGGNFTNLDSGTLTIGTGSNITFSGGTFTTLTRNNATTHNYLINGAGNITINDVVTSATGTQSGGYHLTYGGTGTMTLTNANTYAGSTVVTSGALMADNISGSATSAGAVTASGTGILGGTGTIATSGVITTNAKAVDIQSGATLSPSNGRTGFSQLTLALNNASTTTTATLESGSKLAFNLGGTSTSDEVFITGGKLALNSQQWSDFTFNVLSGFTGGTYTLIDSPNGINGTLGTLTSGTFDGGLFSGSLVLTGTDLELNVAPVTIPEPGTWAMMLGGLALLVFIQRRKAGRNRLF